jgi:hypothetical protein
MNDAPTKRPVPEAYIIRRIRRKLHAQGQELRVSKAVTTENGVPVYPADLGRFYIVEEEHVAECNVSLHDLASRLDALKPWEEIRR